MSVENVTRFCYQQNVFQKSTTYWSIEERCMTLRIRRRKWDIFLKTEVFKGVNQPLLLLDCCLLLLHIISTATRLFRGLHTLHQFRIYSELNIIIFSFCRVVTLNIQWLEWINLIWLICLVNLTHDNTVFISINNNISTKFEKYQIDKRVYVK